MSEEEYIKRKLEQIKKLKQDLKIVNKQFEYAKNIDYILLDNRRTEIANKLEQCYVDLENI